jgi:hypothetical protein
MDQQNLVVCIITTTMVIIIINITITITITVFLIIIIIIIIIIIKCTPPGTPPQCLYLYLAIGHMKTPAPSHPHLL